MKALYIICIEEDKDVVGYHVYNYLRDNYDLITKDYNSDLCRIERVCIGEHEYIMMLTKDHVMHNTSKYIDFLKENFSDIEVAIHVNYHTGSSAPDPILSVHHVGDIISGTYLPHNPKYATNLIVHMERLRTKNSLLDYTCETETTHFSGVVDGNNPKLLLEWNVNNIDLEIGSTHTSMSNNLAIKTICETMFEVFNDTIEQRLNIIYCGGAHFEATYTNAVLNEKFPIYLSHQLCGIWLMHDNWQENLKADLINLISKSKIKVDAIIFHEKVKKIKPILLEIQNEMGIDVYKYNALKNIENSELKNKY